MFSNFAISNFRNPIDLRISAGATDCSRDLELAYYTAVDHDEWRKYTSYFTPTVDLNSIWLEAEYTQQPTYFGHMLIDNLSIEEVTSPPVRTLTLCEDESLTLTAFDTDNASAFACCLRLTVFENGKSRDEKILFSVFQLNFFYGLALDLSSV